MDSLRFFAGDAERKTFYNSLRDGLMLLDKDHRIIFANISATHMLGVREKVITNKHFEDVVNLQLGGKSVHTEDSPITRAKLKMSPYSSESELGLHYTMARNDRSILPVNLTVIPSTLETDINFIVIFHDSAADTKIDQAKSEFIALVSHQLRTPINIISWYVEKLLNKKHGELNKSQRKYLEEVSNGNKRIVNLVQAIVNVSRTDLTRLKHKHEQVNLSQLLRKAYKDLEPTAGLKNITFELSTPTQDVILADSDTELLDSAIKNIILNALRYTLGDGSVNISLKRADESNKVQNSDKSGFIVEVKDNGIGIPDEEKQKVFQKLYRASNVKSLDVTGVGLGLYIAQNFIEQVGGSIWFTSDLRAGSTFYIFIPES